MAPAARSLRAPIGPRGLRPPPPLPLLLLGLVAIGAATAGAAPVPSAIVKRPATGPTSIAAQQQQGAPQAAVGPARLFVDRFNIRPRSPAGGGPLTIDITVKNFGGDKSPAVNLQVWVDQPAFQACGATGDLTLRVPPIPGGGERIIKVRKLKAPQGAGERVLRAFVDSDCKLNPIPFLTQFANPYTVTAVPVSRLSLAGVDWAKNGRYEGVFWFNAVLPSKTFGIRFDVENEGSLDAKVGVIKFLQVAASPGFNSLNFSCGATAEFATSKFKSVVVKPDGKFKTVVVKGLRAPATPGWRTLAGALDADCGSTKALTTADTIFYQDYLVLAEPLPEWRVTTIVTTKPDNTLVFKVTIQNVGLGPGAPGVVSVAPDTTALQSAQVSCNTSSTAGFVSAPAVTTPLQVGKSVTVTISGVPAPAKSLPPIEREGTVLVDSKCQTVEISEAVSGRDLNGPALGPNLSYAKYKI